MLSTLRSDLSEFVSAVHKDTSIAVHLVQQDAVSKLEQLDARVSGNHHDLYEAQVEAEHRMTLSRVYTTPLLLPAEHHPKKKMQQSDEDEDEEEEEEMSDDNDLNKGEEERRELRDYIHTFCVADRTEEISELLMTYPVLKQQMSTLVPVHVSYGEFWMKHFYRCNPERIQKAWDRADTHTRQQRQEQLQHVTKSITEPVQMTLTTVKEKINNATSVVVFGNKYKNEEVPYFSTTTSRKEWEDLQLVLNLSERRISTLQEQLQETDIQIVDTERNALELKTELLQVEATLRALEEKDNEKKTKKKSSSPLIRNKEESTAPPQHQATAVKDQVVPFIEQAVNQVPIVVEKEYDEPGGSETTETASSASAESGVFSSATEDHTINNQMDVEQQQEEETLEPTPSVKTEDEEALNETLLVETSSAPEERTMEAEEGEKYDPIDNETSITKDQFEEEEEKVNMLETSSVEEEPQEQESWYSQSPVVSSSGIMGRLLAPSVLKLFGGEEGDVSDGWDYYGSDDDEEEELFSDMSDDDEEEEEEEHHQRQQYPLAAIP